MTTTKAVQHTFNGVNDQSPLGIFVRYAIEGVGDNAGFGGDRLSSAVELHGQAAAKQLLDHLKGLPAVANVASVEEFVLGYLPKASAGQKDLLAWESLLAEAFAVMLPDTKSDPYDIGKRLISVIRRSADLASPRLTAWGV